MNKREQLTIPNAVLTTHLHTVRRDSHLQTLKKHVLIERGALSAQLLDRHLHLHLLYIDAQRSNEKSSAVY